MNYLRDFLQVRNMTEPAAGAAFWNDLKELIERVVEEMNRLKEFRTKTGGLDYQVTEHDSVLITRQRVPGMSIIIGCDAAGLLVESRIESQVSKPQERQEYLSVEMDSRNPSFRLASGEVLTVEETVYYILRTFLHHKTPWQRRTSPE